MFKRKKKNLKDNVDVKDCINDILLKLDNQEQEIGYRLQRGEYNLIEALVNDYIVEVRSRICETFGHIPYDYSIGNKTVILCKRCNSRDEQ